MGSFSVTIELGDATRQRFERVEALVDTGATYTMVPASLLRRLGVEVVRQSPFAFADGRVVNYDVGVVTARIDGHEGPTYCIFGTDDQEPSLGVYTLDGFLLAADPVNKILIPVTGRLAASAAAQDTNPGSLHPNAPRRVTATPDLLVAP